MSLQRINAAIGQLDSRCELVRGGSCHYFVWDDPLDALSFETESIMVYRTSHLTHEQWLHEARQFIRKQTEEQETP